MNEHSHKLLSHKHALLYGGVTFNVIFPVFFLYLHPQVWLVVLPLNFLIDSLVLIIALKVLKQEYIRQIWKKSIVRVWLLGFVSDLIAAGVFVAYVLVMGFLLDAVGASQHVEMLLIDNVMMGGFTHPLAFLIIMLFIALAGVLIYQFNMRFSFKKLALSSPVQKNVCLALALATAPYTFFVPTSLLM